MARKPKELEEEMEVELSDRPAKMTFAQRWFNDNCPNDRDSIMTICELTARAAEEQFNLTLKSGRIEIYAVVFSATFMSILEYLKTKQSKYNNYSIEIANSINIGYTNNDSDDNEKKGNFQPILEYIGVNRLVVDPDFSIAEATTKYYIEWKTLNAKKTIEHYKEIQEIAYNKLLQEFNVDLRSSEAIIPLFCIFMDHISALLKLKYREAEGTDVSTVSFNVLGLFDAYYSFDDETNAEIFDYEMNVASKLALKNDGVASRE